MTQSGSINYTTRAGDSFDQLALQLYNDEKMAHLIIEANPDYADVVIFEECVPIVLPIFDDTALPETLAPWRRGT